MNNKINLSNIFFSNLKKIFIIFPISFISFYLLLQIYNFSNSKIVFLYEDEVISQLVDNSFNDIRAILLERDLTNLYEKKIQFTEKNLSGLELNFDSFKSFDYFLKLNKKMIINTIEKNSTIEIHNIITNNNKLEFILYTKKYSEEELKKIGNEIINLLYVFTEKYYIDTFNKYKIFSYTEQEFEFNKLNLLNYINLEIEEVNKNFDNIELYTYLDTDNQNNYLIINDQYFAKLFLLPNLRKNLEEVQNYEYLELLKIIDEYYNVISENFKISFFKSINQTFDVSPSEINTQNIYIINAFILSVIVSLFSLLFFQYTGINAIKNNI